MKKIIKLTESDLTRIVKRVLTEEYDRDRVRLAYANIVKAVRGSGTNEELLKNALRTLKSYDEFYELYKMFKGGETSYDSFEKMIDGEFSLEGTAGTLIIPWESSTIQDVEEICDILNKIGVVTTYKKNKTDFGLIVFLGDFKVKLEHDLNKIKGIDKIKSDWINYLKLAKDYWIKWLNDPVTVNKFVNNYNKYEPTFPGYWEFFVVKIFNEYKKLVNDSKLYFYNKPMSTELAYVQVGTTIYVNLGKKNNNPTRTIIHEIQHILYDYFPLNPNKQINKVFNIQSSKNHEIVKKEITGELLKKISLNINIPSSILFNWQSIYLDYIKDSDDPGYVCRETENMSRIESVRKKFNLKPGQNLTVNMFKPYLNFVKDDHEISFMLMCWASQGFPKLETFLNNLNELANKQIKNNPNSLDISKTNVNYG
jgi:hypothetical protein